MTLFYPKIRHFWKTTLYNNGQPLLATEIKVHNCHTGAWANGYAYDIAVVRVDAGANNAGSNGPYWIQLADMNEFNALEFTSSNQMNVYTFGNNELNGGTAPSYLQTAFAQWIECSQSPVHSQIITSQQSEVFCLDTTPNAMCYGDHGAPVTKCTKLYGLHTEIFNECGAFPSVGVSMAHVADWITLNSDYNAQGDFFVYPHPDQRNTKQAK